MRWTRGSSAGYRQRMGVMCRAAALMAALLVPVAAAAAELEPATAAAYQAYAADALRAFRARERVGKPETLTGLRRGRQLVAGPAAQDGIIGVYGGLVHHWSGAVFIRDARLEQVLAASRAYGEYPSIYESVVAARTLGREGDTHRVLLRISEGSAGVSAVLDVRSTIQYTYPGPGRAFAISIADEIREVEGAGTARERLLPAGMDSGYLWRASTMTSFVEREDGVYVVMETVGLSRRFPVGLGWLIEPIARRLGRKSVETSLEEFRAYVLRAR